MVRTMTIGATMRMDRVRMPVSSGRSAAERQGGERWPVQGSPMEI